MDAKIKTKMNLLSEIRKGSNTLPDNKLQSCERVKQTLIYSSSKAKMKTGQTQRFGKYF